MPNWKKVIVSGSSAELTTLKLTGTSGQSSEGTSLMINSSGVVGTRELGSNAFNSNTYNNYSLPLAASGTRGGVKIGFTESGKNYPVELSSEKMFVNVPWTDNNTTYSVGDGGLTQKNFTTTLKNKLDGIAASATNVTNNNQLTNGAGYITSYTDTNTIDMGDGFIIANSDGEDQFTITENEEVRFAGSGATSVAFDAETQKVTISSTDNNTTYSVGDGGLTQKNFTTTLKNKLDGIAASATNVTNNNQITNGAGYITSFTNTTYSPGSLLDLSGTTFNVDLSELTDMTAGVSATVDEIVLLDNGAQRRKRFSEIFGSNAYNSTTIPTNNNQLTNGAGYITSYTDTNTVDMGDGFIIANSDGEDQFTVTENEEIRFAGSGATSVAFDAETQKVTISSTDNNTTYSVGDGGLTSNNFTDADHTKLNGIATGATNTAAPHYTSAISVGDGGLTQKNFTTTLKNKLDGIAASATNVTNNNQLTNGAGYITSYTDTNTVDMGDGFIIANSDGEDQFTVTENEEVRFAGSGATSVAFDAETQKVTISSTDNNTTYSVGDGGLTQKNFTSTLKTKLDGIATSATNVTNNNQLTNGAGYITSFTNTVDMGDGFKIANSAGTDQFTVTENEEIRFAGSGATSVAFDSSTQKVTISSTDNNTTYSVGDGGLTQKNFTTTLKNKLDGIAASANNFEFGVGIDGGEALGVSSGGKVDFIGGTNVTLTQDGETGAITITSTDNNTTYSVGDGGLTQKNFTTTLKSKLDGIATSATNVTNNNQLTNGAGYTTNSGTVTGTGSSNRIATWSTSTNISSQSDLTFDGVTLVAGVDGSTGGRVRTGDGSSSAPAFSFVGDNNTGFYCSTTDTIAATTGGTQRLTINSNGMKVNSGALGVNVNASTTNGRIDASNDIVAYSSDKRLKENIKVIETPLDKLDKLSGFTYNWNETANKIAGFDKEESMVGVFAQDVESVLPEAVKRAPFDNDGEDGSISGENYLTVQYEKLVPLLIESIKELKSEIEELKRGK